MGGADTTIVSAATNAAAANIPRDMSKHFQSIADSHGELMKSISASAAEAAKNNLALNGELKAIFGPLRKKMEDGTLDDKSVEAIQNKMYEYTKEWKAIPKGKKGDSDRTKFKAKVSRYNAGNTLEEGFFHTKGNIITTGGYEGKGLSDETIKFVQGMGNYKAGATAPVAGKVSKDAKEGDVNKPFYMAIKTVLPNGEIEFTVKGIGEGGTDVTYNASELDSLIPATDVSAQAAFKKEINRLVTSGAAGIPYNNTAILESKNEITGIVNNSENPENAFSTLANFKAGSMTQTWNEAIHNQGELSETIIASLAAAGLVTDTDDIKGVGQGDVNMITPANYEIIAQKLLSLDGVDAFANWFATGQGQVQSDKGKSTRKENTNTGKIEFGRGTWMPVESVASMLNQFKNPTPGEVIAGPGGKKYRVDNNGGWEVKVDMYESWTGLGGQDPKDEEKNLKGNYKDLYADLGSAHPSLLQIKGYGKQSSSFDNRNNININKTKTKTKTKTYKTVELKDEEEGRIRKMLGQRRVKKINGEWYVKAPAMGPWNLATSEELEKINKKYK